jgi:3-oxoacyl-(acyl-carrier-protein) synthase
LTAGPIYIRGSGIISPLGADRASTEEKLREGGSAIRPLDLFPLVQGRGRPLPVGQAPLPEDPAASLPRTHRLALEAAMQALRGGQGSGHPPDTAIDAVILGTTTGGILTTEQLLQEQAEDKHLFRYHGLHTVADRVAEACNCTGPTLTVSTACASGAVALALALRMLRSGRAETVLAGGVDSLCRLTYFGFHSLQLVDRTGCKPFDQDRRGMAVAEGAGMLLLSTVKPEQPHPHTRLLGAGLSCDAWHPAAPHPEGRGAFTAMRAALDDAGLAPEDIGYINLHGTGTPDNDLAESKAVRRLFTVAPPLSSIKGASGHSLAAAGAIEAVVSAITVSQGLLPANTGLRKVDPDLGLTPLTAPLKQTTKAVLSNSFGFGGNNASLVIGVSDIAQKEQQKQKEHYAGLAVHGYSCLTGAGDTVATFSKLHHGESVAGLAALDVILKNLPPRLIRRLKRLPRMTLSLAVQAVHTVQSDDITGAERIDPQLQQPAAVFMGTGWGALSDTYDFLTRLRESQEQFPSPTDFVGSVHNSPASQAAILFGATGPNITTSGGDYSFEQALLAAELQLDDSTKTALVLGADEGHAEFSPLLDASIAPGASPADLADGGGAFCVSRETAEAKCFIRIPFYQSGRANEPISALIKALSPDSPEQLSSYVLILVGIPAAMEKEGEKQLAQFLTQSQLSVSSVPVVRYRKFIGEFASASAVAVALAASLLEIGRIPRTLTEKEKTDIVLDKRRNKILVLGLGEYITAVELSKELRKLGGS